MKPLPYTYLAKGRYWRFRHGSVGDFAIRGKPGSTEFMASYGRYAAKVCQEAAPRQKRQAKPKADNEDLPCFLYFIRSADGPVKIGITTNPKKRLRSLQTSHHCKLEMVARFPGTRTLERAVHIELHAHRLRGEWFSPEPAVFDLINELAAYSASQNI